MNGFSNLMNMLWVAQLQHFSVEGIVEGDDGLFAVSTNHVDTSEFAKLGFRIKLEPQTNIAHCSFCKKIFEPQTRTLIGTPQFINKLGWTHHKRYFKASRKIKFELLKSKCMSLYYTFNGCPLLGPVTYHYLQLLKNYNFKITDHYKENWLKQIKIPPYKEPDIVVRNFFSERFGIEPARQLEIEQQLINVGLEPYYCDLNTLGFVEGIQYA